MTPATSSARSRVRRPTFTRASRPWLIHFLIAATEHASIRAASLSVTKWLKEGSFTSDMGLRCGLRSRCRIAPGGQDAHAAAGRNPALRECPNGA
jgi:hypothetical protein